jgi:selT/selW/selH-like putative selenoprotein
MRLITNNNFFYFVIELRSMIEREVPTAKVSGQPGRRTSFEVTVNNTLIFSKLKKGGFPVFESIVEEIVKVSKGLESSEVEETEKSSCTLL